MAGHHNNPTNRNSGQEMVPGSSDEGTAIPGNKYPARTPIAIAMNIHNVKNVKKRQFALFSFFHYSHLFRTKYKTLPRSIYAKFYHYIEIII
jgi:hypothetical protein